MKLIEQLDREFSKFIRLRDSIDGVCTCPLCGYQDEWKYFECMHFVSRKNMSVRYDEINCHAGCATCNKTNEGNLGKYKVFLIEKYGITEIQDLIGRGRAEMKWMEWELEAMLKVYKIKIEQIGKG